MLERVRASAKRSKLPPNDYIILVVDSAALKVFSACCKFFELYTADLFHVETIYKVRKKFPQTNAIYFIEPTL